MHNSKLTQIIASLSDKELKDFEKYLLYQTDTSSYAFRLFQIYKSALPNLLKSNLGKQAVFKELFGSSDFKDVKVREQMSALLKLTESYLILQEQQEKDFNKHLALLKQYRKRNISNLFQQQEKVVQLSVDSDPYLNIETYRRSYLLADEKNNFFEQQQNITHDESIGLKTKVLMPTILAPSFAPYVN